MRTRNLISLLGVMLAVASAFFLFTNETASAARGSVRTKLQPVENRNVLMIGDSLSVGEFGNSLQLYLAKSFGSGNVAAFASCGSSPENWLQSERIFITRCGYRESTPGRPPIFRDFVNGRRPHGSITPKLEPLVRRYNPSVVVVQQGTNWMDRNLSEREISSILHRFVVAARRGSSVRQIIWIEPPDSTAMSRPAQARVHSLIEQAAQRDDFDVIDSRRITKYVRGKTGGDGIHYNSEASRAWAARLIPLLEAKLQPRVVTR